MQMYDFVWLCCHKDVYSINILQLGVKTRVIDRQMDEWMTAQQNFCYFVFHSNIIIKQITLIMDILQLLLTVNHLNPTIFKYWCQSFSQYLAETDRYQNQVSIFSRSLVPAKGLP